MLKVGGFLDRLYFGRHQFTGSVDLDVNSILSNSEVNFDTSSSSSVLTNEPFSSELKLVNDLPNDDHHNHHQLPLTLKLQVFPKGFEISRQEYLSVILLSQVDESLLGHRLRTQVTAVLWIEAISQSGETEVLVGRKSVSLPIERFSEVEKIRETFSRLVEREHLRQKITSQNEKTSTEKSVKLRVCCKMTIEPNFGSPEERTQLWTNKTRSYDLQLNFPLPNQNLGLGNHFQQLPNSIQTHQWMLMRAPGWRRFLFAHLPFEEKDIIHNNNNNNKRKGTPLKRALNIRAPEGLAREAVLEQLRFYYRIKKRSKENNNHNLRITNFWYFQSLVKVALFAEDRDFMAHIFSQLLLEEEFTTEAFCDLPTALAFRRLAKSHKVDLVVAKYDELVEQIVNKMKQKLVEASDLIPVEGIVFPPEDLHLHPTKDAVLNRLLYTLFSEAAVECFLSQQKKDDCLEDNLELEMMSTD